MLVAYKQAQMHNNKGDRFCIGELTADISNGLKSRQILKIALNTKSGIETSCRSN